MSKKAKIFISILYSVCIALYIANIVINTICGATIVGVIGGYANAIMLVVCCWILNFSNSSLLDRYSKSSQVYLEIIEKQQELLDKYYKNETTKKE